MVDKGSLVRVINKNDLLSVILFRNRYEYRNNLATVNNGDIFVVHGVYSLGLREVVTLRKLSSNDPCCSMMREGVTEASITDVVKWRDKGGEFE